VGCYATDATGQRNGPVFKGDLCPSFSLNILTLEDTIDTLSRNVGYQPLYATKTQNSTELNNAMADV
jgi:hypothetical protein